MPQQEMRPQSEKSASEQKFQEPFFIKLEKLVSTKPPNLEQVLLQFRKERIRRLQDIRQSQVIVYYSLESLRRLHCALEVHQFNYHRTLELTTSP